MNLGNTSSVTMLQAAEYQSLKADGALPSVTKNKQAIQVDEVAKDFEAMFMTEMLKPMFKDIKPDAVFGGGKGEEIFNGFMLQEYGKLMAESGQIGIAPMIKEELIRMQGEDFSSSSSIAQKTPELDRILKEQINGTN